MKSYPYFENQQDVILGELAKAKKSIVIAMAWLNFDIYGATFEKLLERNVRVRILLDRNGSNKKYLKNIIPELEKHGAEIYFYQDSGIMHQKICIIDGSTLLTGSFNWTKNASKHNKEVLYVMRGNGLEDEAFIMDHVQNFYVNQMISKIQTNFLKAAPICSACGAPIVNIAIKGEEDYNNVTFHLLHHCRCQEREYDSISYPVCIWGYLTAFEEEYENRLDECENEADRMSLRHIFECKGSIFLIDFYKNLQINGVEPVHAIATWSYRDPKYDDGSAYYKVIWKYSETQGLVDDEYEKL